MCPPSAHDNISSVQPCFFARQPIFQRDMAVWGYQLLYRDDALADSARFTDQDQATVQVALEAAANPSLWEDRDINLLLEFSSTSLAHEVPYALPSKNTIIKLAPGLCQDQTLPQSITELTSSGYRLALDGPVEVCRPLLSVTDYLIVDALAETPEAFNQEMIAAVQTGVPVLVKRIETSEVFETAKGLGASLFLGFFFQRPKIIASKKLSSMQIIRLKLLKMLDSHSEWEDIAKTLQNDVSLTYRLLKFINSPFFGLVQPITNVHRAIGYLGEKKAKIWLRLVILTDLCPPEKTSQLPLLSAQRARFLELAGANHHNVSTDELFLLGLFSLLDAIFDMPMGELVEYLPLTDKLKATLCGNSSTYGPWLDLAVYFEQGRWDLVIPLIERLELPPVHVGRCYAQAVTWAAEFFQVAG